MGRLAYEFLQGSVPQPAARGVWYAGKAPTVRVLFSCVGFFFCGNYIVGWEEGRGEAALLMGEAF